MTPPPKSSVVSSFTNPPTQPTYRTLLSDIFFKKTHWNPQSISLPLISPQQSRQNHLSPIMHCPSTTNPYGTCLMKNNNMVFVTILNYGPTSWNNNTSSSIHLLVIPSQQYPLPPLIPTPTLSLNGPNTEYVLLVTFTQTTGHATSYFLQSFPSLNYGYSSLSLFLKDAKWKQEILNRHFVNNICLMVRHIFYAPLRIAPLSPQTLTSSS